MNLNLLLASTSKVYDSPYLSYLKDELEILFKDTNEILFIPYARPGGISYTDYTRKASAFFDTIDKTCVPITAYDYPRQAIQQAKGIFTGGGNTFLLLKKLYDLDLRDALSDRIRQGCPYLGTSAGSNICGQHIKTTNDMPIVQPQQFEALGVVPYVINPHFVEKQAGEKHQGESRSTRLKEYLTQNKEPVIALPEGTWIRIHGSEHRIQGKHSAYLFRSGSDVIDLEVGQGIDIGNIRRR